MPSSRDPRRTGSLLRPCHGWTRSRDRVGRRRKMIRSAPATSEHTPNVSGRVEFEPVSGRRCTPSAAAVVGGATPCALGVLAGTVEVGVDASVVVVVGTSVPVATRTSDAYPLRYPVGVG